LFFIRNFKDLELKKLICTHYTSKIDLLDAGRNGYVFEKDGYTEFSRVVTEDYNGSFDHPISIQILNEEADIVCTNPPFSRSREY